MSTLDVVRPQGRETLKWDENDPADVARARARFDEEMKVGGLAYATEVAGKSTQIREFDPKVRKITITSPLVGG